ncbi:MAG: DMT family transporter [Casimicrobiaceae bacterium]|nr:DMT family transporter [Casimicrobiaceae bacterium]
MTARQRFLFASVVLLWGLNWPMMKMALAELDPWVFRTWCVLAGLGWFLGWNLRHRVPLAFEAHLWPRVAAIALANVTGWNVLSAAGLALLPSGRAGILAYTMPLWVVILSRYLLGDRLTPRRLAAIVTGMLGIALLLIDEVQTLRAAPVGALLMIGSGLIWAVGIVLTKGVPPSVPTTTLMFWSFLLGGGPIVLGALLLSPGPWLPVAATAWLGVWFNVILVFGFCWFAWNELVRTLPAQVSGISSLAVPFVGFVSGVVVLGETPRPFDYVALAALLAAVWLAIGTPSTGNTR